MGAFDNDDDDGGGMMMGARGAPPGMPQRQGMPSQGQFGRGGDDEGFQGRPGGLRVVGGASQPARRPDLLAAIRHWHRGQRDRTTGILQPWKTLVLTHLETSRIVRQWDLRPDEDDDDLSADIEMVMESHGKPIARNQGVGQTYQVDAYFGEMTTPQANWTGDVQVGANLDSFGSPHLRQRGTPQDFDQQRFRHNELQMQASFGLTRFNVELLVEQLKEARAECQYYRGILHQIEEEKRKLADDEHRRQIERDAQAAWSRRLDFATAKLMRYVPILASRLDEKMFGIAQLSPEQKENKATDIVKTLLSKIQDGDDGIAKLNKVIAILDLNEKEQEAIQELGVMFWLEEQRKALAKEAEMATVGGGFLGLGEDVKAMQAGKAPDKQLGPKE
jgi:hypothetical protein